MLSVRFLRTFMYRFQVTYVCRDTDEISSTEKKGSNKLLTKQKKNWRNRNKQYSPNMDWKGIEYLKDLFNWKLNMLAAGNSPGNEDESKNSMFKFFRHKFHSLNQ